MKIYPALDLLDGQCVRLSKGDFDQKTIYSSDPSLTVEWIQQSGAQYLHLVDLSGARNPQNRQKGLIQSLISSSGLKIQYGGGIRTLQDVHELLELGVDRVVLGSITVTDPILTQTILREFSPQRVTLALDLKTDENGTPRIATNGWKETSNQNWVDWIQFYQAAGLERVLCTDIQRDGMMTGPHFGLYRNLIKECPGIQFQASGGVSSLEDLRALKALGMHSAIVGKALYEGKFSLKEALQC